jgi:hypothetical protein
VPRVSYSTAQRREAVALARVSGVEAAAGSLGIDPRTVRKWSAQAGDGPELDGSAEGWQRLLDLAQSRVAVALATDKVRPKDAAVIAAIAERNLRDLEHQCEAAVDGRDSAVAAKEMFFDWIEHLAVERLESEDEIEPTIAAIEAIVPDLLLKRANLEADPYASAPTGHRAAILAWFSGRTEIPAGDVLEWAKTQVLEVIETHGSIVAWHAFQQAEDAAERVRFEAEMVAIEARAAALRAEAEQGIHDAEAKARRAAAELSRRPT